MVHTPGATKDDLDEKIVEFVVGYNLPLSVEEHRRFQFVILVQAANQKCYQQQISIQMP